MRYQVSLRVWFTLAFLFLTSVPSPTEALQSESQSRDLVIGIEEVTDSLDPAIAFTTSTVFRATYDTLVTFPDEGPGPVVPRLAESWTVSDDGTEYTFLLRDDVVFANGDPLTAEDVVFSIRRLQNMHGNPSFLADPIKAIEAVDDHTVVINLGEPNPTFLAMLASPALSVTSANEVKANGGTDASDAATTDKAEDYLNSTSAGTGPYVLESWERQVKIVLNRNPLYWGKAPYFDRIIIANIPTAVARKDALVAGDIDLALDLGPDQVVDLEQQSQFSVYRSPGEIIHFLIMNQDPSIGGPVANPLVQRAIRYALDYEGYKTLWSGSITPATNLMVGLPGAFGPERALARDLEKAKSLLAEAGYPDGFDITLDYPDTTYGGIDFNTNALKIKDDLAAVGINVELRPGQFDVSLEAYRQGKQGFGYWLWGPNILDPSDLLSFLPDGTAGDRVNWDEQNADPEILTLRDRAAAETDPATRMKIYEEIQKYLQEKGPWAPFNEPAVVAAAHSEITGYVWHPAWQLDVALLARAS